MNAHPTPSRSASLGCPALTETSAPVVFWTLPLPCHWLSVLGCCFRTLSCVTCLAPVEARVCSPASHRPLHLGGMGAGLLLIVRSSHAPLPRMFYELDHC